VLYVDDDLVQPSEAYTVKVVDAVLDFFRSRNLLAIVELILPVLADELNVKFNHIVVVFNPPAVQLPPAAPKAGGC
jgi:hypothetical protein